MESDDIHQRQRKSIDVTTLDQIISTSTPCFDTIRDEDEDDTKPRDKGKQALYRSKQQQQQQQRVIDTNSVTSSGNVDLPVVKVSNTSTLASIICVVAGTGILGIPHAFSRSGWIGLLFLVLSSVMAQFCGCLLIRCLYHGQSRRLSGFPEIGLATFGKLGQIVGGLFSLILLILTPTLYIILAGDNVSKLLSVIGLHLDRKVCTWIVSATVGVPFALTRTMRDVSFMSFFASMATVCLVLVMTIVAVSDFQENEANTHHDWAIAENIPIAFSTFSFSYCGNVIFPHLEASMIDRTSWPKVLLVATFSVTVIYVLMGSLCYLSYGNQVKTPVYNTLPEGSSALNVAMLVATVHVLLAVPMYLYVFTYSVESWLGVRRRQRRLQDRHNKGDKDRRDQGSDEEDKGKDDDDDDNISTSDNMVIRRLQQHPSITRIGLRVLEICFCASIAMLIPYFSDVMSLIGTIAAESLTFILPCIFWIRLSWKDGQTWELVICALIAIVGTFCAAFGTADAVKEFLYDVRHG
ncbi:transmembrane amino acid transporter protein-domain-containing protein [Zychaea mexicana]|uniref:transmembrane amino acid transporter protein-domain-containing protein n=1 Tax=Zychaea mexicana TaxID=64656 RepID=UPI0022FEC05F|nr:transmembrane amino acid transporter protein-domain-containing protein [Zychaea mexicana]KAI9496115.1 transmembrane amino acid transporter protein-domain-containing protein [Zychaea mexicana]